MADELTEHARNVGLAGGCAYDGRKALVEFRMLEQVGNERGEALVERVGVAGEDGREDLGGVEGQADGRDEQLLLRAEEVGDQLLIDPRLGGDRAQRGAVVAVLGEVARGGGEDRLARTASARPAAASPYRPGLRSG